ncbi:SRPBCC domain-containing protein [Olivibacter sp. SDN3]|uniref:SRPBCC domain-containing protein n=1 Tax=Olivibacter sp. SDN3 TaxID=2764720 RepID=UPI00165196F9|nr:SRPBCC domain-containing protein [Olivibacter sp. SDN3]QNL48224.1 SRPBCC domain-containing protein [Olivibacter sp. SDN3]
MEKMQFKTTISAAVSKVFDTMIGKDTFKLWTTVFNPSSDFEGEWKKGSKILFVGTNEVGKKEGMVGIIRELDRPQFVSIEYIGLLDGENEITTGSIAEEWAGFENYSFETSGNQTTVTVDIDVNDQMRDYFRETYPKALDKLKEICE